jgi:hypothetical protein
LAALGTMAGSGSHPAGQTGRQANALGRGQGG